MQRDSNTAATPELGAGTLAELLGLADQEFVECAYWTILGREADPQGLAHYTARLRLGDHRMQVAAALRRSHEGRSRPEPVRGLDRTIAIEGIYRLPVLGTLLALVFGAESNSRRARRHRRIENVLWRISSDLAHGGFDRSTGPRIARSTRLRLGHGAADRGIANAHVRDIARTLTGQ